MTQISSTPLPFQKLHLFTRRMICFFQDPAPSQFPKTPHPGPSDSGLPSSESVGDLPGPNSAGFSGDVVWGLTGGEVLGLRSERC